MIVKVQIIKLLTLYTYPVKILAFHHKWFRNGETWCGWSKYKKIIIFNSAQSFFQL